MKIVCVGDCGVDHYLPTDMLLCGGITSNFARQARKVFPADDEIQIVSAIGSDTHAANLARSAVEKPGFQSDITMMDGCTPVQFIEIEPTGEKNFIRYYEGVLQHFRINDSHEKLIAAADLLVTPVFLQIRGLFDSVMAAPQPALTAVDFADFASHPDFDHLEAYLDKIELAFFGLADEHDAEIRKIGELAAAHNKLLIVTLGAAGCRAFHGSTEYERAAIDVPQVIDTTGAGDAFAAGFLSRYGHGASIPESLESGAQLAAKTVQHQGAVVD